MKYACPPRRKDRLLRLSAWATALVAATSFANPFNDGSSSILATDTNYNETLYVGIQNPNNDLLIIGGAAVSATDVVIGQLSSSTNNSVSVVGSSLLVAGSADTNGLTTGGVVVGSADGGAALSVNNASELNTEYLYVGYGTNDSGSVALSGEGTELNIAQDAFVGVAGSTNSIEVGDGALLNMGGTLTVGSLSSSNNSVNVAAGGTLFVNSTNNILVVNPDDDNDITIRGSGTLQIGGHVDTGTLDDMGLNIFNNANLEVGGALTLDNNKIDSRLNVILNNGLSTNTAAWSSGSLTVLGGTTSDNSLTFTNGATGHAMNILQIGQQSTAARNALNVGGSNSLFIADTDVFIGAQGKENELNISDGGQVDIGGNLYLGNNATATGNAANIHSNGTLHVAGDIVVGDNGAGNELNIDYGTVNIGTDLILGRNSGNNRYNQTGGTNTVAGAFIIGQMENASGDTGFVDDDAVETTGNLAIIGTNAVLNLQQGLTVGAEGSGSIMTIRDGGAVNVDGDVVIGEAVGDNYIYLQRDSNTLFNVTGDLIVGKEGGSNRFAAYGGTANIGGNLVLGATTNQHEIKNFIHVETTNAVINVADGLYIGASNSINTLDLVDGATVNTWDMFVGAFDGVSNNVVTVTGEGSLLNVSNILEIGSATSTNNTVVIQNGGTLAVDQSYILVGNGAGNILQIADGGTLQTIDWDTAAAQSATNVVLDEGSTLELGGSFLGTNRLDGSYELALNGSIATNTASWNTGADMLHVGYATDNNILTVRDGGAASTASTLMIGRSAKSTGNVVTATGTNSLIDAGHNLIVGNTGSSNNELNIDEGARADVGNNLIVGFKSGQNAALIAGLTNAASTLDIANNLTIGNGADAINNTLVISSNATVNVNGITTVGIGTDNNTLTLNGTNALLNANGNLVIGSGAATGNELAISQGWATVGGDLFLGRDVDSTDNIGTVSGSDASLQVVSDLYVGNDGSDNVLNISGGGTVDASHIYVGFTTNSQRNAVVVDGTNSSLTAGGTLYVGYEGNNNTLEVSGGASLNVSTAYVGYASEFNKVDVIGSNSLFAVMNDLFIGNIDTNLLNNNALWVTEGGVATIGGNLSVLSNSVLYIDSVSQITVDGDYTQDEAAILALGVGTNSAATNLVVGNKASFAKDTTFEFVDNDTVVGTTNDVERALVAAGVIEIDEQTATQELLNDYITIANDLLGFNLILSNNIIWIDNVTRLSLADTSGLEPGSQLANVADEIDFLADGSNELAVVMRDFMDTELDSMGRNKAFHDYYGAKESSTPAHNAINMGIQSVSEQLVKRADSTRARMGAAGSGMGAPEGAGGPHMEGQPLQAWITGFRTWSDRSADGGFGAYDGSLNGLILGADMSVANGILVGVAGGSTSANLDRENGASADTHSGFGSLYVSAGTRDWFLDGSLILSSSSIDTTLGSTFDTAANYEAENVALYLGGGKEIIGDYMIITPQASLLGNHYSQDSYEEQSTTAIPRKVDSFDTLYIQSALGCSLAFYTATGEFSDTILKPELRAFWLHEFNDSEESLPYTLVGGTGSYTMLLQAPVADIIKVGGGLAAKMGDYLELRADLDLSMSDSYSDYTLLGSLRYQF